ncbi:DUF3011 domain-containing protein [Azotobacter sp. CWF10]
MSLPMYSIALWGARLPSPASAQQVGYDDEVVTCGSRDMGWVHCDIDVANGVDLVRQLSSNSCIRGTRVGHRPQRRVGHLGCRAEFRARRAQGAAPAAAEGKRLVRRVVRCESNGRPQSCPVRLDGAPVRLPSPVVGAAVPGRPGWGYKRNEVWTSRGCGRFRGGRRGRLLRRCAAPPDLRIEVEEAPLLRREHPVGAVVSEQLSSTPCEPPGAGTATGSGWTAAAAPNSRWVSRGGLQPRGRGLQWAMNTHSDIDYARYDHIRPILWTGDALQPAGPAQAAVRGRARGLP